MLVRVSTASLVEIDDYTILAKTSDHHYSGSDTEMGTVWKVPVSTLAVIDPGDSDIIRSLPEPTGEN